MNPSNARHLRITAAAGTELAVASSLGTVNPDLRLDFFPIERGLRSEDLRPSRGVT